ncbi:ATP-dependent DNA helicase [Trema orientale]|uniref:ATP-dependent DNA helicase n=1 Tax=Trema orientale TaxID=63057 RepID=A0A2P5FNF7_TREOI|nr:ATP-dependent DNA helicase [Trema orientale]
MVQLMTSGDLRSEQETAACTEKSPVKLEIEDSLEEEHGPLSKRSKPSAAFNEWDTGNNALPIPPSQYNPLDEPSPLGLKLRKSPSLLDLIQMKLSQGSPSTLGGAQSGSITSGIKKENKGNAPAGSMDKLKASNFPASLLRIGCWEYKSRYEGDLVAKCYFAKHKLVWEVLEGGLKSKIEIQWSDIMALKANCPDEGLSTLTVVLARQPLFFRETNPQPRKHTLWQATADFTDGQASMHRQHFLQCPQGLLSKHFEKLLQCDMRLNFLSRQPEIVLDSPYFEPRTSVFEDPEESKGQGINQMDNSIGSSVTGLQDVASPSTQSSSLKLEQQDSGSMAGENRSREAPSPSSVMDTRAIEGNGSSEIVDSRGPKNWDQIKVPGLHPSMSMSDLMSHIENCISEQITSGNPSTADQQSEYQDILEDIAQYLLNDNQLTTASDEKSLMTRVNSLCCLLQKDPVTLQQSQADGESCVEGPAGGGKDIQLNSAPDSKVRSDVKASEEEWKDNPTGRQPSGMSRKDSFGELLLHLPRIASLPKFLFNISEEDGDSQSSQ